MSDDLHDLAPLYALDALDGDELVAFERHLATCAACRREVDDGRAIAAGFAEPVEPPPSLRAGVLAGIAGAPQDDAAAEPPAVVSLDARRRRPAGAWLASAAALVVLVVGAALLVGRGGAASVDDVLAAPDAVVTSLELTADGERGTFSVAWSPGQDRVAVLADGLPDPGPDRVYELWAIVDGSPVAAGVFDADGGAVREVVTLDDLEAAAWGVTIEPDGGSTAPTTPILFFAEAGRSA